MDPLLKKFEKHVGLSLPDTAKLLGYAKSSYYQLRNADAVPQHTRRCIEIIMRLREVELQKLIREYVGERDDEL